jgi:fumarate hydratase class I
VLPSDVEAALENACRKEGRGSPAGTILSTILENIALARKTRRPICQDTGLPVFFVKAPFGQSQREIREIIVRATRIATETVPLRPNAVDILTDKNSGDNTGTGFPVIYFEETSRGKIIIDLMLKGAGSENAGQIYKLPAEELKADRNLDGVRKCVLDAVFKAQGRGCPPYIIGVGVGAAKDQVTKLSREQLFRKIQDSNPSEILADLEQKITDDINQLGIGPIGIGGKSTALGVKIGINHRHPASYFVDVSVSCWATRRARLIW